MIVIETLKLMTTLFDLSYLTKILNFYTKLILLLFSVFVICIILIPVSALNPKKSENMLYATWMLDHFINPVFGLTWEIRNANRIIKDQSAVVVCNHQCALDILAMIHIWPHFNPCLSVMKREGLWTGPIGIMCWLSGCIPIDRSNGVEAQHILNSRMKEMKEKKIKLWIFPEGKRNGQVSFLPFKKGAFRVAVQSQIPIIPVVISSYSEFYSNKERKFNSVKVIISVLQPIPTEGLTKDDIPTLLEGVFNSMKDEFNKTSKNSIRCE